MSDRKYRHRGYMDTDRESPRSTPKSGPRPGAQLGSRADAQARREIEGPRSPKMMAFGESVKCAACGAKVATSINAASSCSNCKADLHTCKQCSYFDPGARFECNKTITARIVDKNARNICELFEARAVVERQTSSGAPTSARAAFDRLFKR